MSWYSFNCYSIPQGMYDDADDEDEDDDEGENDEVDDLFFAIEEEFFTEKNFSISSF